MGVEEHLRVPGAVDRVRAEKPAEEEYFRQQENPHPKLCRLLLLFGIGEVVLKPFGGVILTMFLNICQFISLIICHFSDPWRADFQSALPA